MLAVSEVTWRRDRHDQHIPFYDCNSPDQTSKWVVSLVITDEYINLPEDFVSVHMG